MKLVGALAVVLALVLFVRDAAWGNGTGWPYRIAMRVYYRFGSVDSYRKSGRHFASARAVLEAQPPSRLDATIARFVPSLRGWFVHHLPTDKGGWHEYLDVYDPILARYRDRAGLRLLEVGVAKGGSLVLWRELFDESAFIYGIDVVRGVPTFPRDDHITVHLLDSRDGGAVARALGGLRFDVIIDDGLHEPEAQRRTFEVLFPYLATDGVYFIEDVYAFDPAPYRAEGVEVAVHDDPSGQQLVVLCPPASLARTNADRAS